MFQKLKINANEQELIDFNSDMNCPKNIKRLTFDYVQKLFNSNGLNKMIISQYFVGNKFVDYYGDKKFYDYDNYVNFPKYYQTGFDIHNISDNSGTFYLVHPDESNIIRNICGDIVGILPDDGLKFEKLNKYKGDILSKKIRSFWQTLLDYMYVSFSEDENDVIKTDIGCNIVKLFEDFKFDDHNMFRAFIFGMALGCHDDIMKLVSLYPIIQYSPTNLSIQGNDKYQSYQTKGIIQSTYDNKSDNAIILETLNDFHSFLDTIGVSSDIRNISHIKKMTDNTDYSYNEYMDLLGPDDKYSAELKKKIIMSDKNNIIENLKKELLYILYKEFYDKREKIISWCSKRNIDFKSIVLYYVKYIDMKCSVNIKLTKNILDEIVKIHENFKVHSNLIFNDRKTKLLDLALLLGFPFNVCKKMKSSDYYLSLYSPVLTNAMQIETGRKYKYAKNSLMSEQYLQNYLLYIKINVETDGITCLQYVTPELITLIGHIYSKSHFKKMKLDEKEIIKFIANKNDRYEVFKIKSIIGSNLSNAIINYNDTIREIQKDCIPFANVSTLKFIEGFDTKLGPYVKIIENISKSYTL